MLGGYRYYNTNTGNFIKADSFTAFTSIHTLNGFNYGTGNPVLFSDQSGHTAFLSELEMEAIIDTFLSTPPEETTETETPSTNQQLIEENAVLTNQSEMDHVSTSELSASESSGEDDPFTDMPIIPRPFDVESDQMPVKTIPLEQTKQVATAPPLNTNHPVIGHTLANGTVHVAGTDNIYTIVELRRTGRCPVCQERLNRYSRYIVTHSN